MSHRLRLLLVSAVYLFTVSQPLFSQELNRTLLAQYPNMQGTTGAITTATAHTLPKGHGYISIQESFILDSLDRVHITVGLTNRLEVGLRSDIPQLLNPRLSMIVKFNAFLQDSLFQGMPALSVGMHRGYMYLVSSYRWNRFSLSGGWNKTAKAQGFFANASVQFLPAWTLQADVSPVGAGIALRARWKSLWLSLIYYQPRIENQRLEDYFWEIGYHWEEDHAFNFVQLPGQGSFTRRAK
ncbi:MAG TPA: hypothetical protein DCE41_18505 [Cytophagales bacterium]|nr:hypothetical protein [Cytophagales bacterium]